MADEKQTHAIYVRIDKEVYKRLKVLCAKSGKSITSIAERAMTKEVARLERTVQQ